MTLLRALHSLLLDLTDVWHWFDGPADRIWDNATGRPR
jgi:hypothetical protein